MLKNELYIHLSKHIYKSKVFSIKKTSCFDLAVRSEDSIKVDIKEKVIVSLWCPLVKVFEVKVNSGLALFVMLVPLP